MNAIGNAGQGPAMPARVRTQWAREVLLAAVDEKIRDMDDDADQPNFDEAAALKKERNRIAKLFNLPLR